MNKIAGHYASKYANKALLHRFGAEDPYYEIVEEKQSDGTIKQKKIKKKLPEGISRHDTKILKSVKRRAYYLELFFGICGLYCGWSALIGLVPFVGFAVNLWFCYRTVRKCEQIEGGLSSWERSKMTGHVTANAALSFIPIVGDIAGAIYKPNTRIAALLEHCLIERSRRAIAVGSAGAINGGSSQAVDPQVGASGSLGENIELRQSPSRSNRQLN